VQNATNIAIHPDPNPGLGLLWASLLLPPLAWTLHFSVIYAVQPHICLHDVRAILVASAITFTLMALGGGAAGWHSFRLFRDRAVTELPQRRMRARFMALLGIGESVLFVLIIVAQAIPFYLLSACPT
jgi:hypothetical protein